MKLSASVLRDGYGSAKLAACSTFGRLDAGSAKLAGIGAFPFRLVDGSAKLAGFQLGRPSDGKWN